MKKGLKKISGFARSAVKGVAGNVAHRIREEVDEKARIYKKKVTLIAWELMFFIFGIILLVLGFLGILENFLDKEYLYLIVGLGFIIAGMYVRRRQV